MKTLILLFCSYLITAGVSAQQSLHGSWEGAITLQGQELGIQFHFEGEPGSYTGTLDIPAQGAKDLSLIYVVVEGDSVSTAFNTGTGIGEFIGTIRSTNLIEGTYTQSGAEFPFRVERQDSIITNELNVGEGEELLIKHGNITIGGTLVVPEEVNEPPIVILLTGSGAQNRDSEIVGFKPFALIADHLKSEGISSFRYDDREVGKSTGSFSQAGLETLASDVQAIVGFLQDSVRTEFGEFILLGHSQGGIIAAKVADINSEIDKVILMASPAVSMSRILRFQVEHAYEQIDLPSEKIEDEIEAREQLMRTVSNNGDLEEATNNYKNAYRELLNSLTEEQLQAVPEDKEGFIERQASQLVSMYRQPQLNSFLFYDPAQNLSNLSIPVLALFGGKDIQVPDEINVPPVRKALEESNSDFDILVLEEANHLFQEAETGEVTEYGNLEKEFADDFLRTLSEWIHSN